MPDQARGNQEEAVKDLQKAQDALSKKQGEEKKEDGKQGSSADKKEAASKQQQDEAAAAAKQNEQAEQAKTGLLPEEARDILEEERQNREQRDTSGNFEYKPVDKDW